jgi:hypothetical protein
MSLSDEAATAGSVPCRLRMLSAVHFGHYWFFPADEVADVSTDRNLPCELVAVDLAIADTIPQNHLCVRLIGAQRASRFGWIFSLRPRIACPSTRSTASRCSDLSLQEGGRG